MFDLNQRRLKKVTRLVDKLLCELFGVGARQLQPRQYDVQIPVACRIGREDGFIYEILITLDKILEVCGEVRMIYINGMV